MKRELRKAIHEYYKYSNDSRIKAIRFITSKNGVQMVLVQFTSEAGREMSSLVSVMEWADGHYDVTEMFFAERKDEESMCKEFEETGYVEWEGEKDEIQSEIMPVLRRDAIY